MSQPASPLTPPLTPNPGHRDIGQGLVSQRVAWAGTALFLLWIASQSLVTAVDGSLLQSLQAWTRSVNRAITTALIPSSPANGSANSHPNRQVHTAGETLEEDLTNASWLRRSVRTWGQYALTHWAGVGNTHVYLGDKTEQGHRWLFFTPATDHVLAPDFLDPGAQRRRAKAASAWDDLPQTDPWLALRELKSFLLQQGVDLVVVPAPSKAMLAPQYLMPSPPAGPLLHPEYDQFLQDLNAMGVTVVDPVVVLDQIDPDVPRFLTQDSHWTPETMDRVAQATADQVGQHLGESAPTQNYRRRTLSVSHGGDLVEILALPQSRSLPEQSVAIRPVFAGNRPWRPDPQAPVLLLGDSFSNIYSQESLGWGTGAGFAEQLSYYLHRPVDKIVVNAGGAHGSREAWARDLASGDRSLEHLEVVVYEFAARELSWGDWQMVRFAPLEQSNDQPRQGP